MPGRALETNTVRLPNPENYHLKDFCFKKDKILYPNLELSDQYLSVKKVVAFISYHDTTPGITAASLRDFATLFLSNEINFLYPVEIINDQPHF